MRSVMDLDVDVSRRQSIGAHYEKPSDLQALLAAYKEGKLVLPPQPTWHGEPTAWDADPFNDRNWRFQHHTLRWLNPLRWAALSGDEACRQEWVRVVRSWMKHNVPADTSPSDFAWVNMVDGNRAVELCLGAPLVSKDDTWFISLLEYHRDWLMDPNHIVGRNHGLHQHSGLLVLGATLRDSEAVETAVKRMREQFQSTFDTQGTNDEGSAVYHQHNTIWWSEAWKRVELEGLTPPEGVRERLAAAGEVLAHLALPNGELPQIGDGARVAVRKGLSELSDYVSSAGTAGTPPRNKVAVLDRGYIIFRSGWGVSQPLEQESHTVIRYGDPHTPRAHSHEDRGSIHIYTMGQRWLVDSGFYSYQGKAPENIYLNSRAGHNVATIVGKKHDNNAPVELVEYSTTEMFYDFTLLDRGYASETLKRRVVYFVEADCWIIADSASSPQTTQIKQDWIVEPGVQVRVLDNGFRLDGDSTSFGMYWLGRGTHFSRHVANDKALDGWVSTKWRTLVRGAKLTATSRKGSPKLVSLLAGQGQNPLGIIESHVSAQGHIRVHVSRGVRHWKININDKGIHVVKK